MNGFDEFDINAVRSSLINAGLPTSSAEQKLELFRLCHSHISTADAHNVNLFFVPGRIEVLGKHTDYAGGDSLLCAVSHGFCFVAGEVPGNVLTVINAASGEVVELPAGHGQQEGRRRGHWSNYPDSVWRRLRHNLGRDLKGTIAVFASDLPEAAGLSSSSALVVGTFMALDATNAIRSDPAFARFVAGDEALGDFLGCVENGRDYPGMPGTSGVGTTGGSQDQTAILCAEAGQLQHFSFSPTTFLGSVPMPENFVFAIASSGVVAAKTGDALEHYNRVGARASEIVRVWNDATGKNFSTLGEIARRPDFDPKAIRGAIENSTDSTFPAQSLVGRFDQFCAESFEIIPGAIAALRENRISDFAAEISRSQRLAEQHLENQVPATIALVQLAAEEGAVAASAFGAGFGGSVWAMVSEDSASEFVSRWASRYKMLFAGPARQSRFFVERPGPGAFRLRL